MAMRKLDCSCGRTTWVVAPGVDACEVCDSMFAWPGMERRKDDLMPRRVDDGNRDDLKEGGW